MQPPWYENGLQTCHEVGVSRLSSRISLRCLEILLLQWIYRLDSVVRAMEGHLVVDYRHETTLPAPAGTDVSLEAS